MSDYERQIEEALARKSMETEKKRKTVQSEANLMNSLRQAFSKSDTDPETKTNRTEAKSLEQMLAEAARKEEAPKEEVPKAERILSFMADAGDRVSPETTEEKSGAEKIMTEREQPSPDPIHKDEPLRYRKKETHRQTARKGSPSFVFAAILTILLAAAGISGGFFYALYTYLPMADAVNNSSCAAVLESEYLAGLNNLAAEEGVDISFSRDALVGGQAVKDIKAALKAAYSGKSYQPDTERISEKIALYAEGAGAAGTEQLAARAGETYSAIIAAAPDASWVGQTGSLGIILVLILAFGIIGSVMMLVLLAKHETAGKYARFSFAGAALFLEMISVIVMATGVFRRYSAAYSYIAVLSTRYMMGGIIACMAVGAFYMVLAAGTTVISSK